MEAVERRKALEEYLRGAQQPVPASLLAMRLHVSRQIIVGDVALLRAGGVAIIATPRGYLLPRDCGVQFTVACFHAPEAMRRELEIMVDCGCTVRDVVVEHPIYGQLCGQLHLSSRSDVAQFLRRSEEREATPLSVLTGGLHLHTLCCRDEAAREAVTQALQREGFLYS